MWSRYHPYKTCQDLFLYGIFCYILVMKKILNSYIKASILLKLAKLSDSQYAQIYKNTKLKNILSNNNLLDLFYNALPEQTENSIRESFEMYKKQKENIIPKDINDPIILNFLKKFGEEYLFPQITSFFPKYISKRKESSSDIIFVMEKYGNTKIKDIIYDYIQSPNVTLNIIYEFIEFYEVFMLLNNTNSKHIDKLKTKICDMLYNISAYTHVSQEVYDINYDKTKKALELRESDIFDFVLQEEQSPVLSKHKKEQEIIPEKPSVKIDYADESTTKK